MSEEELALTYEALAEEFKRVMRVYDAAERFCEYTVNAMNADKIGLATETKEDAIQFLEKLKDLVQALAGEEDGTIHYEYEQHDDGASGGPEADSWEEGGDVRPSSRKLH